MPKYRRNIKGNTQPPLHNNQYRNGVGAVIINKNRDVLLCQRVDKKKSALQMPQGGIDDGESETKALFRELMEEVGSDKFMIITSSQKIRKYRFPNYVLRNQKYEVSYMGQRQKWFLLFFFGEDNDLNLSKVDKPEFSSFIWCDPDDVPRYAVKFKQKMYKSMINEFYECIKGFDYQSFLVNREKNRLN